MIAPIKTKGKIVITQPWHPDRHQAVDIRSVDFISWRKLPIVATEDSVFKRYGIDGYGNSFIVLAGKSGYELQYIHIKHNEFFSGDDIAEGTFLGVSEIYQEIGRGNSYKHHLHFEVVINGVNINPFDYFRIGDVQWVLK